MRTVMLAMLTFAWVAVAGCGDPVATRPRTGVELVLVRSGMTGEDNVVGEVRVVDPSTGHTRMRMKLGRQVYRPALSPDGNTLYVGHADVGAVGAELLAIDLASGTVAWRIPLPSVIDGVTLRAEVLATSPDGNLLYLTRSERGGVFGVAALDLRTRRVVGFSGPWNTSSVKPISPSTAFPEGAVALVASRINASGGPYRGLHAYFLHPVSLTPIDSILPGDLAGLPEQEPWQILPTRDGHTLYIAGSASLIRYDPVARRVVESTPRLGWGAMTLMADGSTIALTDSGEGLDFPGSGLLHIYGSNLDLAGAIDVSTPLGGRPRGPTATVTRLATAGADGRTLYVPSGTGLVGPLYPVQPARVLVVDIQDRAVRRVIELGGYGSAIAFERSY